MRRSRAASAASIATRARSGSASALGLARYRDRQSDPAAKDLQRSCEPQPLCIPLEHDVPDDEPGARWQTKAVLAGGIVFLLIGAGCLLSAARKMRQG